MKIEQIIEDAKAAGLFSPSVRNGFTNEYVEGLKKFASLIIERQKKTSLNFPLQTGDEFTVTLKNTPIYQQAYDLIQAIEALGQSIELTAVVTQASRLANTIVMREINFHYVCKAFNELNAPTNFGEPVIQADASKEAARQSNQRNEAVAERDIFELWYAKENQISISQMHRTPNGEYLYKPTQGAWVSWQARANASPPQTDAVKEALEHRSNEWADCAVNGLQWLKNIKDGISNPDDAISEMESNIKRIRNLITQPESEGK